MVKQYMTTADVAGEVACLRQSVVGMRLINIYDISAKTYVLKLGTSGEEGQKIFVVMESGVRVHTTKYDRGKSDFPSNFTLKIRKHIRGKRLTDIRQLGIDRIVDFSFGREEGTVHLILELYSQGNIVLTDSNYEVLTLLRSHRDDDKGYALMARHPYPVHSIRLSAPFEEGELRKAVSEAKEGTTLKGVVSSAIPYGGMLAEHCVLKAGLDANRAKMEGSEFISEEGVAAVMEQIRALEKWFADCWTAAPEGYILVKGQGGQDSTSAEPPVQGTVNNEKYQEFEPLLLKQHESKQIVKFETFDAALDEFFSKSEGQKMEASQHQAVKVSLSKVEKTRLDQQKRAEALHNAAADEEEQARLIETNLEMVDAAISAVNEVLATGMDWKEVGRLIKEEREAGNPVAGNIHSLELEQNKITMLLADCGSDDEPGTSAAQGKSIKRKVQLDLSMMAHANARLHYGARKKHQNKEKRTQEATGAAVKAAEKKAQNKTKQKQNTGVISQLRKPLWFERFTWFISSENYLVISGRDAQQNELLVKRYMGKSDLYVHADLHGAPTTIVKNHRPNSPVPSTTLHQAGAACVCRSKAWDDKLVTSAWWVYSHQISKTAPAGEYLQTGGFMVRGKKNFLPPTAPVYGFGFMFKLEESCAANHRGERAPNPVPEHPGHSSLARGGLSSTQDPEGDGMPQIGATEDDTDAVASSTAQCESEHMVQESGSSLGPSGSLDPSESMASTSASITTASSALDAFLESGADVLSRTPHVVVHTPLQRADPDPDQGDESPSGSNAERQHTEGPRKMSRRERKEQKRGKALKVGEQNTMTSQPAAQLNSQSNTEDEDKTDASSSVLSTSGRGSTQPVGSSGKRGKQRKLRKYADQDDEDREVALQILGSAGERKTAAQRKAERKERKAANRMAKVSEVIEKLEGGQEKRASMQEAIERVRGSSFAPTTNDTASAKEFIEEQQGNDLEEPSEECKEDSAGAAEGIDAGEAYGEGDGTGQDKDQERLSVVDSLTGCPKPEDTLLFAVAACGPYDALANYKYKVKLTPGPMKKGKAAKQAMDLLSRSAGATPIEVQLLKAVPDPEVMLVMLSSTKVTMPGLENAQSEKKKGHARRRR
eukprot:evm.model.scf_1149.3 EVM.evm.TU.scf_1149.3   scf_1149:29603-44453(-)